MSDTAQPAGNTCLHLPSLCGPILGVSCQDTCRSSGCFPSCILAPLTNPFSPLKPVGSLQMQTQSCCSPAQPPWMASFALLIAIKMISVVFKVLPGQPHLSPAPTFSAQVTLAFYGSPHVPLLLSVTGPLHLPFLPLSVLD